MNRTTKRNDPYGRENAGRKAAKPSKETAFNPKEKRKLAVTFATMKSDVRERENTTVSHESLQGVWAKGIKRQVSERVA